MIPIRRDSSLFLPIAAVVVIVLLVGVFLLARTSQAPETTPGNTVKIGATIFPIADIAQNIAGDNATVVQLLPPGASPHSYSPTPNQLADMQDARKLFIIGHGLDDWAVDSIARNSDVEVITVDEGISLHEFGEAHEDEEHADEEEEHEEGSIDPHYWLTVPNGQQIARTITEHLIEIDPEHADAYEQNLERYLAELNELEQALQETAQAAPKKEFFAIHDGWSYFAEQYGFELVGTYEPVEGRQPSPSQLQNLQSVIREHGITRFFTEPQKESTGANNFITQDLGLTVKILDPVGGVPPRDSFINLMRENVGAIVSL